LPLRSREAAAVLPGGHAFPCRLGPFPPCPADDPGPHTRPTQANLPAAFTRAAAPRSDPRCALRPRPRLGRARRCPCARSPWRPWRRCCCATGGDTPRWCAPAGGEEGGAARGTARWERRRLGKGERCACVRGFSSGARACTKPLPHSWLGAPHPPPRSPPGGLLPHGLEPGPLRQGAQARPSQPGRHGGAVPGAQPWRGAALSPPRVPRSLRRRGLRNHRGERASLAAGRPQALRPEPRAAARRPRSAGAATARHPHSLRLRGARLRCPTRSTAASRSCATLWSGSAPCASSPASTTTAAAPSARRCCAC
jgi:hypothetical protein